MAPCGEERDMEIDKSLIGEGDGIQMNKSSMLVSTVSFGLGGDMIVTDYTMWDHCWRNRTKLVFVVCNIAEFMTVNVIHERALDFVL